MTSRRYYIPDPPAPEMERLRKAYADRAITMSVLSARFRMSDDRITRIATSQGWPLRPVARSRRREEAGAQA